MGSERWIQTHRCHYVPETWWVSQEEADGKLAEIQSQLAASQERVASLEETEGLAWDSAIDHHAAEVADLRRERDEAVARAEEAEAVLPALRRLVEVAGRVFRTLEPYSHLDPLRGELASAIEGVTRPDPDRSEASTGGDDRGE